MAILSVRRNGVSHFYHHDGLGSTAQLTDANQNVTDSYVYRAFGEEQAVTGTTPNPLRFVGNQNYHTDGKSGLVLLGVRWYDTSTGRFLSADPAWGEGPPYSYSDNDPVNLIDPEGRQGKAKGEPKPKPPFWDTEDFQDAVDKAQGKCPGYNANYIKAILSCLVELESGWKKAGGYTFPLPETGGDPLGPCQIVPGSDKNKLCGKGWNKTLQSHMNCCAKILCSCLNAKGGNLVTGCGTTGFGKKRKGQFQVINQSGKCLDSEFKSCLLQHGVDAIQVIPKS